MHLLLLGLILVVGILVYYIMTTDSGKSGKTLREKSKIKTAESESHVPDDLRKEDNVIFLPTAGSAEPDDGAQPNDKTKSDAKAGSDDVAQVYDDEDPEA